MSKPFPGNAVEIWGRMVDGTKRALRVAAGGYLEVDVHKPYTIKTVTVTKNCPAAAEYTAEDILSENVTEGIGMPWEFDLAREPGGSFVIIGASVQANAVDITPRFSLRIYTKMPTTVMADNVLNKGPAAADKGFYVDAVEIPALSDLADGAGDCHSSVSTSTVGGLPIAVTCENNSDRIICLLVTRDTFTLGTTTDVTVKLRAIQL